MPIRQFSTRTLLIVTAMIALYFPCNRLYLAWLVNNHAQAYVESLLHSDIKDGDSFNYVASHFISNRLLTRPEDTEYINNFNAICSAKGLQVKDDDELYHFAAAQGPGAYLLFRDKKVVNFWNSAFIDARFFPNQTYPSETIQRIFVVSYVSLFASALLIDRYLQHRASIRKRSQIQQVISPAQLTRV